MKIRSIILSSLAAAAFATAAANAAVPPVDPKGVPAWQKCPSPSDTTIIYHFDKIIFQIAPGNLAAAIAADTAALNAIPRNTELDIKVLDDPNTVAELKGKVLTFLGAVNSAANRLLVRIISVQYASVVCPRQ
jgi:hypothetical protein